jgi:hypothetical protein
MWENLSLADIERAKEQLKLQRDEILKRHAEELGVLDTDQSEIDTLDQLIGAFWERREGAVTSPPPEPAVAEIAAPPEVPPVEAALAPPAPAPAPLHHAGDKPAVVIRQPARRDYSGTNFDTFSKAVSKLL